ncbi:hypothetical protein [Actinoplanes sp. G11-F43]|uniref:hypothetical protein n=1 Tax=Actinoplanes sp. G11-F43 TaxID=3424130 RepID=UPI003D328CC1
MAYGEGYSDEELDEIARRYAATDDDQDYQVVLGTMVLRVRGINSARAVAGRDGTWTALPVDPQP